MRNAAALAAGVHVGHTSARAEVEAALARVDAYLARGDGPGPLARLKPNFGRLSRSGSFPFMFSFDHLGSLARSITDLVLFYDAAQCSTPTTRRRHLGEPVLPTLDRGCEGLQIAVVCGYFARGVVPEALRAVQAVANALGTDATVESPEAARARAAAYVVTAAEGAALYAGRLRTRAADFDPAVRDCLLAGLAIPVAWVAQAQHFRRRYRDRVAELFTRWDAVIAPATPIRTPKLGQMTLDLDGTVMPLRPNIGVFTQPLSFIGFPVVAVPVWPDAGLPIGVQVIVAPWRENLALRIVRSLKLNGVARCRKP